MKVNSDSIHEVSVFKERYYVDELVYVWSTRFKELIKQVIRVRQYSRVVS
jgi:hypothetical protein